MLSMMSISTSSKVLRMDLYGCRGKSSGWRTSAGYLNAFLLKTGRMQSFDLLLITSTSASTPGVGGSKVVFQLINKRLEASMDRIPWYWMSFIKAFVKEWAPSLHESRLKPLCPELVRAVRNEMHGPISKER